MSEAIEKPVQEFRPFHEERLVGKHINSGGLAFFDYVKERREIMQQKIEIIGSDKIKRFVWQDVFYGDWN